MLCPLVSGTRKCTKISAADDDNDGEDDTGENDRLLAFKALRAGSGEKSSYGGETSTMATDNYSQKFD